MSEALSGLEQEELEEGIEFNSEGSESLDVVIEIASNEGFEMKDVTQFACEQDGVSVYRGTGEYENMMSITSYDSATGVATTYWLEKGSSLEGEDIEDDLSLGSESSEPLVFVEDQIDLDVVLSDESQDVMTDEIQQLEEQSWEMNTNVDVIFSGTRDSQFEQIPKIAEFQPAVPAEIILAENKAIAEEIRPEIAVVPEASFAPENSPIALSKLVELGPERQDSVLGEPNKAKDEELVAKPEIFEETEKMTYFSIPEIQQDEHEISNESEEIDEKIIKENSDLGSKQKSLKSEIPEIIDEQKRDTFFSEEVSHAVEKIILDNKKDYELEFKEPEAEPDFELVVDNLNFASEAEKKDEKTENFAEPKQEVIQEMPTTMKEIKTEQPVVQETNNKITEHQNSSEKSFFCSEVLNEKKDENEQILDVIPEEKLSPEKNGILFSGNLIEESSEEKIKIKKLNQVEEKNEVPQADKKYINISETEFGRVVFPGTVKNFRPATVSAKPNNKKIISNNSLAV